MKKFVNAPQDVLAESLLGLAAAHPELDVDQTNHVVFRATRKAPGRVALVSGGGSGHEPMHAGFVGPGMLDAAACGAVFTSPVPEQVEAAIAGADAGAGVLQIVKNYTGDVLNFDMGRELAQASADVEVETVVVADDCSVQDSTYTAGRRGTGATVLVEKIAGAAAEAGRDLADVAEVARTVADNARSFGIALTSCTVPEVGHPTFDLGEDEIEIGVGIHGEPGRRREKWQTAAELATTMVEAITADMPLGPRDEVLAFVDGLGGTPLIEQYLLYHEVTRALSGHGVRPVRNLVGSYMTSLDMAGASLTLLRLTDDLRELWDAPVNTPGLRWGA